MWEWVSRPVRSLREGVALFATSLFLCLFWSLLVSSTLQPALRSAAGRFDPTDYGWAIVPLVAASVVVEEVVRLFPLAIIARLAPRRPVPVLGTAVVTAALFGAAHVTNGLPLGFVLLCQGVVGFVMNLLYLKVGGLHRRMLRGFLFTVAFHLAFDLVILVPALLLRRL